MTPWYYRQRCQAVQRIRPAAINPQEEVRERTNNDTLGIWRPEHQPAEVDNTIVGRVLKVREIRRHLGAGPYHRPIFLASRIGCYASAFIGFHHSLIKEHIAMKKHDIDLLSGNIHTGGRDRRVRQLQHVSRRRMHVRRQHYGSRRCSHRGRDGLGAAKSG
jgi:hypothetical protein